MLESKPVWDEGPAFSDYPEFGSVPDSDLPAPDKKPEIKTGEFNLKLKERNLEIKVLYRIPMEGEKAAAGAANLVFIVPHPLENTKLQQNHQKVVTDVLGCGMFSFQFKAEGQALSDPKLCYWSPESGWLEAVWEAREKLCGEFGLEKRKLILMGESAGSNMAQSLAVHYPEEVEAAALIGGQEYQPVTQRSPVSWLISNTRGDSTTGENKALTAALRALGTRAFFVTPAPEHQRRGQELYNHVPGPQSRQLVNAFIWGILQARKESGSFRWYQVSSEAGKRYLIKSGPANGPGMLELGGASLAQAWARVSPPVQKLELAYPGGKGKVLLGFPALPSPKGVVIYYDELSYLNYGSMVEDVASLAENGYAVIAPAEFSKKKLGPEAYLEMAKYWIQSQGPMNGRPLSVFAKGRGGLDFLALASRDSKLEIKAFALMQVGEADFGKESVEEVKALAKKCDRFVVALREEEVENKDFQRLAKSMLSNTAEKAGSRKVEVKSAASEAELSGKGLLAWMEMLNKLALGGK
ncbi:MAG: lysophospholipase [Blastochloris sp.]|nr:lysophospholipase [Blastochloris sp.]